MEKQQKQSIYENAMMHIAAYMFFKRIHLKNSCAHFFSKINYIKSLCSYSWSILIRKTLDTKHMPQVYT